MLQLRFLKTDYGANAAATTKFFEEINQVSNQMTEGSNKKAIILLSGGLDSATVLAHAVSEGFQCHCLSFDYGQSHRLNWHRQELWRTLSARRHIAQRTWI